MTASNGECPKCGGAMQAGFMLDRISSAGGGKPLLWVEAVQLGLASTVKPGHPGQIEVDAQRCTGCGFVELYAGTGDAEPS